MWTPNDNNSIFTKDGWTIKRDALVYHSWDLITPEGHIMCAVDYTAEGVMKFHANYIT